MGKIDPKTPASTTPLPTVGEVKEVTKGLATQSVQPQSALPPVPSAKGDLAVSVDPGTKAKYFDLAVKTLATLKEQVKNAPDKQAEKTALQLALNRMPPDRADVKQSLTALIQCDDDNFDACIGQLTDRMDHGRATMREVVEQMKLNRVQDTGQISGKLATLKGLVNARFDDYLKQLSADPAEIAKALPTLPGEQAVHLLHYLGVADENKAWSMVASGVKPNELAEAMQGRRAAVLDAKHAAGNEIDHEPPARGVALLLLRYPALLSEVAEGLGLPQSFPPDESVKLTPDAALIAKAGRDIESTNAWVERGLNASATFASFFPVAGSVAAGGIAVRNINHVIEAAALARASAFTGLVTPEQARKLNDEIPWVVGMSLVDIGLSSIPGAAAVCKSLKGAASLGKGLEALGKLMKDSPVVTGALLGGLHGAASQTAREHFDREEYAEAALEVLIGVATGAASGAALKIIQKSAESLRAALKKPPAPPAPVPSPEPAPPKAVFERNQSLMGGNEMNAAVRKTIGKVSTKTLLVK